MSLRLPLDEAGLATLVGRFYARVRVDPELGPVFDAAVHDWTSVALGTRRYRGNPMAVHRGVPGIDAAHFQRWLELWRQTAADVLDADGAAAMTVHAERIGRSLREGLGLARARGLGLPVLR